MPSTASPRRLIRTVGKDRARIILAPVRNERVRKLAKYGGLFFVVTTVAKIVVFGGAAVWALMSVS